LKLASPGFVGDALGQPVKAFTLGLLALAALVLLVACANLAQRAGGARARTGSASWRSGLDWRGPRPHRAPAADRIGAARRALAVRAGCGSPRSAPGRSVVARADRLPVQFDVAVDPAVCCSRASRRCVPASCSGRAGAPRLDRRSHTAIRDGHDARASRGLAASGSAGRRPGCGLLRARRRVSVVAARPATGAHDAARLRSASVSMVGFELGLGGYSTEEGKRFQQRALPRSNDCPAWRPPRTVFAAAQYRSVVDTHPRD